MNTCKAIGGKANRSTAWTVRLALYGFTYKRCQTKLLNSHNRTATFSYKKIQQLALNAMYFERQLEAVIHMQLFKH